MTWIFDKAVLANRGWSRVCLAPRNVFFSWHLTRSYAWFGGDEEGGSLTGLTRNPVGILLFHYYCTFSWAHCTMCRERGKWTLLDLGYGQQFLTLVYILYVCVSMLAGCARSNEWTGPVWSKRRPRICRLCSVRSGNYCGQLGEVPKLLPIPTVQYIRFASLFRPPL